MGKKKFFRGIGNKRKSKQCIHHLIFSSISLEKKQHVDNPGGMNEDIRHFLMMIHEKVGKTINWTQNGELIVNLVIYIKTSMLKIASTLLGMKKKLSSESRGENKKDDVVEVFIKGAKRTVVIPMGMMQIYQELLHAMKKDVKKIIQPATYKALLMILGYQSEKGERECEMWFEEREGKEIKRKKRRGKERRFRNIFE